MAQAFLSGSGRDPLDGLMERIVGLLACEGPMSLAAVEQAFQAWGNVVLLAVDRLCEQGRVILRLNAQGYELRLVDATAHGSYDCGPVSHVGLGKPAAWDGRRQETRIKEVS